MKIAYIIFIGILIGLCIMLFSCRKAHIQNASKSIITEDKKL